MQTFYSNGKLLITGEYTVLDGALALAVPTKFGQELRVDSINESGVYWRSISETGHIWFEAHFTLENGQWSTSVDNDIATTLIKILDTITFLNPKFFSKETGFMIESTLNFNRQWGLGSSSTLINNLANWAQVNAYQLLEKTFGGSGYDIACAAHDTPITYQLIESGRTVTPIHFNPPFQDQLYFVYLNKKQNSRHAIAHYKDIDQQKSESISQISDITLKLINSSNAEEYDRLIASHEAILSKLLQLPTIKQELFPDFNGCVKSLGAWGGDFIMVRSNQNPKDYFYAQGFDTIISFTDMVK